MELELSGLSYDEVAMLKLENSSLQETNEILQDNNKEKDGYIATLEESKQFFRDEMEKILTGKEVRILHHK